MSNMRIAAAALMTLAIALAVLGGPVVAGSPTTRYVDDDGTAGRSSCSGTRFAWRRIQRAVDLSGSGDIVKVCPGTYRGHIAIGPSKDSLRLLAATSTRPILRPVRMPPTFLALDEEREEYQETRGVVHVDGATGFVLRGFRFLPHGGTGECGAATAVTVTRQATARIVDNVITGASPFVSACLHYGTAVFATDDWSDTPARAVLERNVVRDFDAAVRGLRSVVRVAGNRFLIRGDRPVDHGAIVAWVDETRLYVLDNVVRVDAATGADVGFVSTYRNTATISRNVVEGITQGIDVYVGGAHITDNVLLGRSSGRYPASGIVIEGEALVSGNLVTGFRGNGIEVDSVDGSVVRDNDARGNRGIDCRQPTPGGVRWRRNLGYESKPRGLCTRN